MAKLKNQDSGLFFGRLRHHRREIAGLLILFALAYAVVGQLAFVGFGWQEVVARPSPILWSIISLFVSYGAAAGIYCLLTSGRLKYGTTYLAQMAASFVSRIVPAGLGGVGLNYLYLRRQGFGRAQAGKVVAVNNLLGVVGNMLLLVFALIAVPIGSEIFKLPHVNVNWLLIMIIGLSIVAFLAWRNRRSFIKNISQIATQLSRYRRAPGRLLLALILSVIITTCYGAILLFSAQVVGVAISPTVALLSMTVGVAAISVTPTPGGLGGVEAGIVAVLTLNGLTAGTALAIALIFRVITFWLPIVLGSVALFVATKFKIL